MNVAKMESSLKCKVKFLSSDLITRIDPSGYVLETLVANDILTSQQRSHIEAMPNPENRAKELLSILFNATHSKAFIIFKEALQRDHSEIVRMIDGTKLPPDEEHDAVSDSKYELVAQLLTNSLLIPVC